MSPPCTRAPVSRKASATAAPMPDAPALTSTRRPGTGRRESMMLMAVSGLLVVTSVAMTTTRQLPCSVGIAVGEHQCTRASAGCFDVRSRSAAIEWARAASRGGSRCYFGRLADGHPHIVLLAGASMSSLSTERQRMVGPASEPASERWPLNSVGLLHRNASADEFAARLAGSRIPRTRCNESPAWWNWSPGDGSAHHSSFTSNVNAACLR